MQRYTLFRIYLYLCAIKIVVGALAHLARAFDWQSRGGEFESRMLHKRNKGVTMVAPFSFLYNIAENLYHYVMLSQ